MINMLDLDSNGRINYRLASSVSFMWLVSCCFRGFSPQLFYSELCSGKQDVIQERRRRVKLVQKKTLLDRQRMRLPTAYFKFDVTGKWPEFIRSGLVQNRPPLREYLFLILCIFHEWPPGGFYLKTIIFQTKIHLQICGKSWFVTCHPGQLRGRLYAIRQIATLCI